MTLRFGEVELSCFHCGLCEHARWYILEHKKRLTGLCANCGNLVFFGKWIEDKEQEKVEHQENKAVQ